MPKYLVTANVLRIRSGPGITHTIISYRVDANTLNLRQGARLNHATIGTLKKGEVVEGLAVSTDNQWAQVHKSSGVTGWASPEIEPSQFDYTTRIIW
ncbi:MAG: SH3 domain-containing protein [Chloroflexota bacterium]|nr:SH3 domain-containing protein [Chloroflexota bacterium]